MINYELAKQLKEAGYPQCTSDMFAVFFPAKDRVSQNGYTYHNKAHWKVLFKRKRKDFEKSGHELTDMPNLSELIEACEMKIKLMGEKDYWVVTTYQMEIDNKQIVGSTPEEAVARLWLELNKK